MRRCWWREEVQESQGPRVSRSRGPKVQGSKGPRYLKLTFKYELDSKEGPSCFYYFSLDSCDVIKQEVNNNVSDTPKSGPPSSELNISDILSLKTLLPASIPEAGDEVEVTVSYAVSPDNFVILVHSANGINVKNCNS